MKLRYYADSSFEDDHEGVLHRLRDVNDSWGIPVEIIRVRERHGAIESFPGEIREMDMEEAYERDFKFNQDLSENLGHSPSDAFETKSGLITIAGSVGVVDGDLRWATMLSGTPPDTHSGTAHTYSISFLDDVLDRGLEALDEKVDGDEGALGTGMGGDKADTIAQFVDADVRGLEDVDLSMVSRNVTAGSSTALSDDMTAGARQVARDVATRTVDAVIEADQHWVIEVKREFTAENFDSAVGEILIADALYRADEGLLEDDTRPAILFGEFPGGIDLTDQPAMLSFIVGFAKSENIEVFVGTEPERIGAEGREFVHLTAEPEIVPGAAR